MNAGSLDHKQLYNIAEFDSCKLLNHVRPTLHNIYLEVVAAHVI
jgi:hypothetical protein